MIGRGSVGAQKQGKAFEGSINGFVNLLMELKKCCNHASLVRAEDSCEGESGARLQVEKRKRESRQKSISRLFDYL